LANQIAVLGIIARQAFHEFLCAGLGYRAQMLDSLFAAHADAVIRDGDGAGLFVDSKADLQFAIAFIKICFLQGLDPQLVAGIRSVRHQLAQKDIAVAIQRMNHEVQQLLDLGLKG